MVPRFEFDIIVVDKGGIYQINDARKLIINMQESGNIFEFKTKKNSDLPLYVIPVRDIETPTVIETQTKQTIIGKRNNLLLDSVICFLVPHSDKSSDSNLYGGIFPTMELEVTSTTDLFLYLR